MDPTKLAALKAELLELPKNPNPTSPYGERRTLVIALLDEITFLRQQQGYSFVQISKILQDKAGVEIKPLTLKKYFFEEVGKLKGKKSTGPRRRKASSSRSKSRSSKATEAESEASASDSVAEQPKAQKTQTKAKKADKAPAPSEPEPEPDDTSPVATREVADDDWGTWDEGDDDSYTTGLINEPTFNRIRRS